MLAGAKYGLDQIPARWLERLDRQVVAHIRRQVAVLVQLGE
jgi:ADP-ribosyl-[dinitrogen reductase] hydrolase